MKLYMLFELVRGEWFGREEFHSKSRRQAVLHFKAGIMPRVWKVALSE